MRFTYLEKYGGAEVIRSVILDRRSLKPGKWFYLRTPKIFMEKILPKLNHRLDDFADIKFGIKTGANGFFYMKDITHLYGTDFMTKTQNFKEYNINARTGKELETQGLIYIENEDGEKFIINRRDVVFVIRSPKQLDKYIISNPTTLCLYTDNPGKHTLRYILHGENLGLPNRPTLKNRKPWFKLYELNLSHILLPMSLMEKIFIPISENPVACDHRLYTLNCKKPYNTGLYLNSTIFLITIELFCRRLGGGASDIMVEDYKQMPVPNLLNLGINYEIKRLNRDVLPYFKEIKKRDRRELDIAVLKALGFEKSEAIVDELYSCFIEVIEDRIIKAGRPIKRLEEENNDQDN